MSKNNEEGSRWLDCGRPTNLQKSSSWDVACLSCLADYLSRVWWLARSDAFRIPSRSLNYSASRCGVRRTDGYLSDLKNILFVVPLMPNMHGSAAPLAGYISGLLVFRCWEVCKPPALPSLRWRFWNLCPSQAHVSTYLPRATMFPE